MNPEISVVVPVKDEAGNAGALAEEIAAALAGTSHEIIFVDDGSGDGTPGVLLALRPRLAQLRVLKHGRNAGQSAALRSGIEAARGALIVTLDGDGQNDPADIPKLVSIYRARYPQVRLVAGQRAQRKDTFAKRAASRIGNGVRGYVLQDSTRDTGCGLKAFERAAFLKLPYFDHIHRYLPALFKREGYGIALADVGHRPRQAGRSKYTNLGRLAVSVRDLLGVMWLMARRRPTGGATEL